MPLVRLPVTKTQRRFGFEKNRNNPAEIFIKGDFSSNEDITYLNPYLSLDPVLQLIFQTMLIFKIDLASINF
jgi:hypothetical protein